MLLWLTLIWGASMEIDPVCQMPVDAESADFKTEYKGKEYFFCSSGCYDKFIRNARDYV